MPSISLSKYEEWCATCPKCKRVTKRHSIDGGLTSIYKAECGHTWRVDVQGRELEDGRV